MKRFLIIFAYLSITTVPVHADIAEEDLPSMGNLARLLGTADAAVVDEEVYDEQGNIAAGMPVSDDARGNTSKAIAKLLADGNADHEKKLSAGFDETRLVVEDYLTNAKFDVNDMGVSLALSFITLWELASDVELSETASFNAGKFLVHNFSSATSSFEQLEAQEQAKLHDYLMTTPIAFAALVKTFEEQGGTEQQVTMLRTKSADLFVVFVFEEDGSFNVNMEFIEKYQEENNISSDW